MFALALLSYDPARSPVTYTLLSNGLVQFYQTGAYTGGNPRALNVTWTCSQTATTPTITSYSYTNFYGQTRRSHSVATALNQCAVNDSRHITA